MAKTRIDETASYVKGREVRDAINDAIRHNEKTRRKTPRGYLSSSSIGGPCTRRMWLNFRLVPPDDLPDPRMVRLWARGHREEPEVVALLQAAGYKVWTHHPDNPDEQLGFVGYRGHEKGHIDGMVMLSDQPPAMLLEIKTHSDKSFTFLVKNGVAKANPEHLWQMQTYMRNMNLSAAMYVAVNKNNDDLHIEIIEADAELQTKIYERVVVLVESLDPPAKISDNPTWWQCKMCDFKSLCHGHRKVEPGCRSCKHVTVGNEGKWLCGYGEEEGRLPVELTMDQQRAGCGMYDSLL